MGCIRRSGSPPTPLAETATTYEVQRAILTTLECLLREQIRTNDYLSILTDVTITDPELQG